MKRFWSKMILIACVLTIGFTGILSMTQQTEAHPKRLDVRHTTYWCHEKSGGHISLCKSWTSSGSRAVWPWANHWAEDGPHKPHDTEGNKHSYDSESYTRPSCSDC